ncbi:MAG TPA: hypothetical protein VMG12_29925 [Polyangiaceae bacterium]|nr:hypothetical protein [Polyangiaceae bacterium]
MRPSAALFGCLAGVFVAVGALAPARAQSIRDTVRQHVTEGLDQSGEPPKKKAKKRRSSPKNDEHEAVPPASDAPTGATPRKTPEAMPPASQSEPSPAPPHVSRDAPTASSRPAPPASAGAAGVAPEERLPLRVFGKNLELDAKVGGGVRGWYPEQYPLVSVDHASYLTWSLDLKAKILGFLRLHRGYYESNGLRGPRTQGAVVARDVGQLVPKAAWLLGTLGVPLSRRWETLVSYETRSFVTRARPTAPVAIVDRKTSPDLDFATLPRSEQALEFVSGFETLVLGVRYFPERGNAGLVGDTTGPIPPMYLGVGFTQYSKPYQVKVGADALDEILFNGRFRGAGLAYGLATSRKVDLPYVSLDTQLGLGEVSLLEDLTLNELLPEDWLIGYLQGNVTLGYILPLLRARPTPLLTGELSAGGATFFYFQVREGDGQSAPTLPLNWDLFWAVHVSLTLPL